MSQDPHQSRPTPPPGYGAGQPQGQPTQPQGQPAHRPPPPPQQQPSPSGPQQPQQWSGTSGQPAQSRPQPGYAPAQPGYGYSGAPAPARTRDSREYGYFRSLFDLGYKGYGAEAVARVVQILFMVVTFLGVLIGIAALTDGFDEVTALGLIVIVIVMPLLWLLVNGLVRLVLETAVASTRTEQNTAELLEIARARGDG